jgi:hypothetical protein
MTKDNQIEQMAKDMCEYYYEGTCYQDKKPCDCKCDIFTDAQYLYAKGYRKASDVAREIFAEIDELLKSQEALSENKRLKDVADWIFHDYLPSQFAELKKKYESEGEE